MVNSPSVIHARQALLGAAGAAGVRYKNLDHLIQNPDFCHFFRRTKRASSSNLGSHLFVFQEAIHCPQFFISGVEIR